MAKRYGLIHRTDIYRSGAPVATDVFCHLDPIAERFQQFLDGPFDEVLGRWRVSFSPRQDVRYQDELHVTSPGIVVSNRAPIIIEEIRPAETYKGYLTAIAVQREYDPFHKFKPLTYAGRVLALGGREVVRP